MSTLRANRLPGDLVSFQMPRRGVRSLLGICVSAAGKSRCIVSEETQRDYRTSRIISNGAGSLIWDVSTRLTPCLGILYHTEQHGMSLPTHRILSVLLSASPSWFPLQREVWANNLSTSCQTFFRNIFQPIL